MQLGNHTRDWYWLGMSCTSDQSQCFIFLTGHRHRSSTGYKYKLVVALHLYRVNCPLEQSGSLKLSLALNLQSAEGHTNFKDN